MKESSFHLAELLLTVAALVCWVVMFLAGTDVWHDVGSPNVWNLQNPPFRDLRAFLYAYYLLFFVLVACLLATVAGLRRARKAVEERG